MSEDAQSEAPDDTSIEQNNNGHAKECKDAKVKDCELCMRWLATFLWLAALLAVAGLFVRAWISLPENPSFAEPVAPGIESEVMRAMEAATTPADRANFALQLADIQQQDAARRNGLRNSIAQVGVALLAGTAAAWGAIAAWNQMKDNRRHTDALREETDLQITLARSAQLAERFSNATDQLGQSGGEKLNVRLGGIYALGRIARHKDDMPTVVGVLTAFVRGHSPREEDPSVIDAHAAAASTKDGVGNGEKSLSRRAPDVQAALTVLGGMERGPEPIVVDLAGANLNGADLRNAHLEGAFLRGAHLQGAYLADAHLEGADLWQARLERANLTRAGLEDAYLVDVHLEGSLLWQAKLQRARLQHARLQGANLWQARLSGANLSGAFADDETNWPNGSKWQRDCSDFDHEAASAVGVVFG